MPKGYYERFDYSCQFCKEYIGASMVSRHEATCLDRNKECPVCKNPFRVMAHKKSQVYCSHHCYMIDRNRKEPGLATRAATKAATIQKQRRGSGKGYIKEEGRHQHRLVAERMLGRPLLENEIVHHKDHNKKNNNPDNLEIMTQAEHARLHSLQYWKRKKEGE